MTGRRWTAAIAGSLGILALAASLAGNLRLWRQLEQMRKTAPQTPARPRHTPPASPGKTSGYAAKLGPMPVRLRSAKHDGSFVMLKFLTDHPLESAVVRVTPETPIGSAADGDTVLVCGEFVPGQKYRFTVKKGAKNRGGGVLEQDAVAEITIPNLPSAISFVSDGAYLPLHGGKFALPFRTVNVKEATVQVSQAYENNLNPYRLGSYDSDRRMLPVAEKRLTFNTPTNREVFHELDLSSLLGGRRPGVFRVVLGHRAEQYVSITDLAVQVAEDVNAGKLSVFVRSLATGKPAAGAEITVMSAKNQVAAAGRTGPDGGAILTYDPKWPKESDRTGAVVVRHGGDFAFFPLRQRKNFADSGSFIVPGAPRALVFAERGAARPGERITVAAFLRREQDGEFRVMPGTALNLSLTTPTGRVMFDRTLRSDEYGFARTDFELPDTAETGVYALNCRVAGAERSCGRSTLAVANYVPDRIKVSGRDFSAAATGSADALEFEFEAKYYFGAPLKGGSGSYQVTSDPAPRPNHWERSWHVGSRSDFRPAEVFRGRMPRFDGKARFSYPGFTACKGNSFDPVLVTAEFTAAEPGGRGVTGRVTRTLWPTPFYLGVRESEKSGPAQTFEYTLLPARRSDAIRLEKELQLTFSVTRLEWEYALVRAGNLWKRRWRRREIPLPKHRRTVTLPAGEYRVGRTDRLALDLPAGEYRLDVSAAKLLTRLEFARYAGDGGGRSGDPNTLYFRTDAEKVAPGSEVTFSFDAAGPGEAFLVYGADRLDGHRTLPVRAGANRVTLTVPRDLHRSSFSVGCTVVVRKGEDFHRSFGVLKVNVDQSRAHRLNVGLKHPDTAEPEAAVPVTVTLTDAAGRPQSGAVCLYAVDSGVTALTDYRAPDIFRAFYGPTVCPMEFYDMYGLLFEELRITPDGRIGGDGATVRKLDRIAQQHTARLIAPLVQVPASGAATVQVRLPDHTGAMDIFAVASGERAVGSEQSRIVMRKPVTVTVSAPRFLAPGDTAELAFTVFNHDAPAADGRCAVTLPPMLETVAATPPVFACGGLSKGQQRTFKLRVRAKESLASGRIAAELTVGAARARSETCVTVRSVNVSRTTSRFLTLAPGEKFQTRFRDDYLDRPEGRIRLAASPALPLRGALEWLNAYPHGCLEQTTAGAFPFIVLPELLKAGLIDAAMAATHRHKVADAYAQLLAMALADGSFAMWPGDTESWREGSVFALHFIFEAEKRSLLTPDPAPRRAYLAFLRSLANGYIPSSRAVRAYSAYVLATAGDPGSVTPARNLISGTDKPDYALFLAGAALVRGGYASVGAPVMLDALKAECWREAAVPTAYSDAACRLGMTLRILLDCAIPCGDLPERLALQLARSLRPDGSAWGTTQANAWAALGLAAYAGKNPPRPATAEITAAGRTVTTVVSGITDLPASDGTTVVNRSSNRLIVETRITGIPRRPPQSGGKLVLHKEFLDEQGRPVTEIAHGSIVLVRLTCASPVAADNIVISDLLPAGLEIEDELLVSRAAAIPKQMRSEYGALRPKRLEKRDDRFLVFGDMGKGRGVVTYRTRAVVRGVFAIPPLHAEAMYQPDLNGVRGGAGTFTVK